MLAGFCIGASWLFAWLLLSQIYGKRLVPAIVRAAERVSARLNP